MKFWVATVSVVRFLFCDKDGSMTSSSCLRDLRVFVVNHFLAKPSLISSDPSSLTRSTERQYIFG